MAGDGDGDGDDDGDGDGDGRNWNCGPPRRSGGATPVCWLRGRRSERKKESEVSRVNRDEGCEGIVSTSRGESSALPTYIQAELTTDGQTAAQRSAE